jgi:hypothetical protein
MKMKLTKAGNLIIYVTCKTCGREYNTDRKTHALGKHFYCDSKEIFRKATGEKVALNKGE